jgi:hypothetical protein
MKKTGIFIVLLLCVCSSCKTPQYIPVETTKIEYRDNFVRDSISRYDSIFVKDKGDTLIFERYRYLYRDKIVRDSIFKTDTIRVPYPVEVVKEVKKPLSGWQNFQVWCGRIALVFLLFLIVYFVLKLKKFA